MPISRRGETKSTPITTESGEGGNTVPDRNSVLNRKPELPPYLKGDVVALQEKSQIRTQSSPVQQTANPKCESQKSGTQYPPLPDPEKQAINPTLQLQYSHQVKGWTVATCKVLNSVSLFLRETTIRSVSKRN